LCLPGIAYIREMMRVARIRFIQV